MEAAVASAFSPGDKVIAASTGVFGDRFVKIASRFGLDVDVICVPWETGLNLKIENRLNRRTATKRCPDDP